MKAIYQEHTVRNEAIYQEHTVRNEGNIPGTHSEKYRPYT